MMHFGKLLGYFKSTLKGSESKTQALLGGNEERVGSLRKC